MKKICCFLCLLPIAYFSWAQSKDSTQTPPFFSGVFTATNNGISLLPNFSLNKPAALFDLSMGKGRWSFDPMLRFGTDAKPWAFVFWGRYKLIQQNKFTMGIGAHPSVVFKEITTTLNGITTTNMLAQRYVAWEATPTYTFNKNVNVGIYYLGSHGLTADVIQNTIFLAAKATFSNLNLSNHWNLTLVPQFYYLEMDSKKGIYTNGTIMLSKKGSPFAISSIVSKAIETEIAGKDFVWNVALHYNFNKKYLEMQEKIKKSSGQ
jgi:hypothetical protein